MLKKELNIFTFKDLLNFFPFRHIDKTKISAIKDINFQTEFIQVAGKLEGLQIFGEGRSKRLVGYLRDKTGVIELVWFQGINWVVKNFNEGSWYLVFGKTGFFNNKPQIVHPEIELFAPAHADGKAHLEPVYPSTEKLKARSLNGRQIAKLTQHLLPLVQPNDIEENIPQHILQQLQMISRFEAYQKLIFLPINKNTSKHCID